MQFELLDKHHNRQAFDCGNDEINRYLWQMASQHHKGALLGCIFWQMIAILSDFIPLPVQT
ncbi:hypothetical protein [Moraxella caprae]|uniref:hypothetical protein n=1 Tax=Moraxella caprae TaxID=90240 RepID=UPI00040C7FA4|nr:hypothetical protein [Moraxella caprae]